VKSGSRLFAAGLNFADRIIATMRNLFRFERLFAGSELIFL